MHDGDKNENCVPNRKHPLNIAAESGNVAKLVELLDEGADIETRDPSGKTAIFFAVGSNQLKAVRFLLEKGANVNAQDDAGKTPLHVAAKKCLPRMVALLLEAGADIKLKTKKGNTALIDLKDVWSKDVNDGYETYILLRNEWDNQINRTDLSSLKDADIDSYGWIRFYHALETDDAATVKILIDRGLDINERMMRQSETLLHIVASRKCPKITTVLLEAGVDVNAKDSKEKTPLHLAALHHSPSLAVLLRAGANVDAMDGKADTPLHYAVRKSSDCGFAAFLNENAAIDIVEREAHAKRTTESIVALIEAGATVDSVNYRGRTPLFEAVYWSNKAAVKMLIEKGADVNFPVDFAHGVLNEATKGETPLHTAAQRASLEIMAILLEAGGVIEAQTELGKKKPIAYAIRKRRMEMVEYLMKRGAESPDLIDYTSPNNAWAKAEQWYKGVLKSDTSQDKPDEKERLCRVVRQREENTLSILLRKRKTNINAPDKHGYAAIHWAALEGNIEMLKALLDAGADLESRTEKGCFPLYFSTWRYMLNKKRKAKSLPIEREATLDAMRFLIERGANVNAVNQFGCALLHTAAMNGEIEIMAALLDNGADIELGDNLDRTPLFHAVLAQSRSLEGVKFLIDHGAKINVRDKEYGRTPLHWAAVRRAIKIANYLIGVGGTPILRDNNGRTVLDYMWHYQTR